MKFSCDRCGKLFSTASEPVPGRVYRVHCRCGNTIVLYGQAPGTVSSPLAPRRRTVPPPLPKATAPAAPPRSAAADEATPSDADPSAGPIPSDGRARDGGIGSDAPTAIVDPDACAPAAPARRDPDLDASGWSGVSGFITEMLPAGVRRAFGSVSELVTETLPAGVRRASGSLVEHAEAFVLLHVTARRAGVAAVAAAAVGLATWISVATSGSTPTATHVIAVRAPDRPPEPAPASTTRVRRARWADAGSGSPAPATAARNDGPQRLPETAEPIVAAPGEPGGAPEADRPSREDQVRRAAEPEAIAAEPIVVTLGQKTGASDASTPRNTTPSAVAAAGRPPTARDVLEALRNRQSALEECIDEASTGGPPPWLGRRVRLVVTVDPSGRVSNASIEDDDIVSTQLAACIRRVAKGIFLSEFEGAPVPIAVPLRLGDAR